jgi:hypothetical protein
MRDQSITLHMTRQKNENRTSISKAEFESEIPMFEWAKPVCTFDCAATGQGNNNNSIQFLYQSVCQQQRACDRQTQKIQAYTLKRNKLKQI